MAKQVQEIQDSLIPHHALLSQVIFEHIKSSKKSNRNVNAAFNVLQIYLATKPSLLLLFNL